MAKTESVQVPDELRTLQRQAIELSDPFVFGTAQAHKALTPDRRRQVLKGQSVFRFLSPIWKELTTSQKNLWQTAGAISGLSGWQLFVSDNAARIRTDLPLDIPPSNFWQVNAGYIKIESPASEILLRQEHPNQYYEARKIPGASWKQGLTIITEQFTLPLTIRVRYKSDLVAVGAVQRLRFFARIWTSYQGQDIYSDLDIPLNPVQDWTLGEATEAGIRGILIGYSLNVEVFGYRGELMFDNIRAEHSGSNWARDSRCDNINRVFRRQFALVPPYWVPEVMPTGATYSSQFPPHVMP